MGRGHRHGVAAWRALAWSVVLVLLASGVVVWIGGSWVRGDARGHGQAVPAPRVIEALPAQRSEPVGAARDMIESVWCAQGPEAVVRATDSIQEAGSELAASEASMWHAMLRCEALLTQGQVEAALELNRRMCDALRTPTPAQSLEPLALEQHARLRMAGGETNMLKQEERLLAIVEARQLLGQPVQAQAWATLAALQKARGDCDAALKQYAQALVEVPDAPAWARLRTDAPWKLELLAFAAMDRADCLATVGEVGAARKAAIAVAADLAVTMGDANPLAQQAADLRDRLVRAP